MGYLIYQVSTVDYVTYIPEVNISEIRVRLNKSPEEFWLPVSIYLKEPSYMDNTHEIHLVNTKVIMLRSSSPDIINNPNMLPVAELFKHHNE